MKKLILSLAVITVFTAFNSLSAQITIQKDTAVKTATVNTSEKQIKTVIYKDITYYIINGIWHTKTKKRYVLRAAPKGAKIEFTPKNGKTVTMGGKKYYKCKGIFYKKLKEDHYEVVRL